MKTRTLTQEQYEQIISVIRFGFLQHRGNDRIATILVLEANLGLRISDVLNLRLSDIVRDGSRYRLDIVEQKTGKKREFTVPTPIYNYIQQYCIDYKISSNDNIFPVTARMVQKHLKAACDYLGLTDISTHSFRKFFATQIYINNNYNIVLVQKLLQHSSTSITQRYIGISSEEIETALANNINLL